MNQRIRQKVVDSNEPGVIRERLLELGWEQRKLHSADYWFFTHDFKKVGITRKEVGDFMHSIGDRFSGQLEEMLDFYDINILLLEGSWKQVLNTQILARGVTYQSWDMCWNYIHRWMAKGFILELTTSIGHTIHRLNVLYAKYQQAYSLSAKTRKFTDDRVLAFPSGCRGKTGQTVLETLGSLRIVAEASPESLEQIKDVGKKRAELIYNHFNRGTELCLRPKFQMD